MTTLLGYITLPYVMGILAASPGFSAVAYLLLVVCIIYPHSLTFAGDRGFIVYTSWTALISSVSGWLIAKSCRALSVYSGVPLSKAAPNSQADLTKGRQWLRWAKSAAIYLVCCIALIPYETIPDEFFIGILLTIFLHILPGVALYYLFRGWDSKGLLRRSSASTTEYTSDTPGVTSIGSGCGIDHNAPLLPALVHDGIYQAVNGVNHAHYIAMMFIESSLGITVAFCIGHLWFDQRVMAIVVSLGLLVFASCVMVFSSPPLTSKQTTQQSGQSVIVTFASDVTPSAPPPPAPTN